jgi:hypothetical protein
MELECDQDRHRCSPIAQWHEGQKTSHELLSLPSCTWQLANARTCIHHTAYYSHTDCLCALLSATQTMLEADSWGFPRLLNMRDEHGAMPLHLAARRGRPKCVHLHAVATSWLQPCRCPAGRWIWSTSSTGPASECLTLNITNTLKQVPCCAPLTEP